ncbi:glucose-1-phosphate cytidylyltransferase [Sinomicrobium kalidii]|uniref:glucose-1-phosphate cytidylyltransferase n=1 Tax=Sinomicrobium kalidii TaxID=2900738 RepID=UPI001E2D6316|nr:glucose-1-phosphate cytidylyltransferase [Sinomicrobium kalidii]UGU14378.1 glucose-1-phosphate cytidylyltransferase [Sinomicrobium kalidii]
MKVLILAGGFGTRLSEETATIPKPMVQIGDKPILWHIMKIYSHYGYNDFVILGGYKAYVIKEYFSNYYLHQSDVRIDLTDNSMEVLNSKSEPWKITILDTGLNTLTGGRIKRAKEYINNEPFFLTYGDGLSNVNINKLLDFHREHGKSITMTSVQPEGRFGALDVDETTQRVNHFMEKPKGDGAWINGGFFVCEPDVLDYIDKGDETIWERSPLENLAKDNKLYAFNHYDFWKPMDTLRDKNQLEELWNNNKAPWKLWK